MITAPATANDFARWEKQARKMTESELEFSIKDCLRAAEAMATHTPPNREGYYRDQAATFQSELTKRQENLKRGKMYVAMIPYVDELNVFTAHAASKNRSTVEKYLKEISDEEVRTASYVATVDLI